MEILGWEELELTVEDLLQLHRSWITKLYTDDKNTAAEIVILLHERRLIVTLAQIEQCIATWELAPPRDRILSLTNTHDDCESTSSASSTTSRISSSSNTSYTPDDPDIVAFYTFKPLPAIPGAKRISESTVRRQKPTNSGQLQVTYHNRPLSLNIHDVHSSLDAIPRGLSPLDMYTGVEESHERIAIGLQRALDLTPYRRAERTGDGTGDEERLSAPRICNLAQKRKRGPEEEEEETKEVKDESNRNMKTE